MKDNNHVFPNYSISRRQVVLSLGVGLVLTPRLGNTASLYDCNTEQTVAALVPQTGPWADAGANVLRGVSEGVKQSACKTRLVAYDSMNGREGSVVSRAVEKDNASIVVGDFGITTYSVAVQNPNTLIIDLKSSLNPLIPNPANAIALPVELFYSLNPKEHQKSLRYQAFSAVSIALNAISEYQMLDAPSDLVSAMSKSEIKTSIGIIRLNTSTRIFQLV